MKKLIFFIVFFVSAFCVFASFDYGLSVNSVYNTKDKNINFSYIPFIELDDFKLYLRANWSPKADGTDGFDDFFKYDGTNSFTIMDSVFKYIEKISYGKLDDFIYVGAERGLTFKFDNKNSLNQVLGKNFPGYFEVNTPYIEFQGFVDDISFKTTKEIIPDTAITNAHEYRSNFMGMGVKMAPHKLSPVTIGLNILYNFQSRYFNDDSILSTYHFFTPEISVAYNTKFTDDIYFSVGASGSLDMPYYSIYDEESDYYFSKWNKNFAVTLFTDLEFKDFNFGFSLYTNQKYLTYRRAGKDMHFDGESNLFYNYIPGTAYGIAFDFNYDLGRNANISASYVLPLSINDKLAIFKYKDSTFDDLLFNFSIGNKIRFYGGFELEGLIGFIMNKDDFIEIFNKSSSNVNAGIEYKTDNLSVSSKAIFNGIDVETKKPDFTFFIGVNLQVRNFIK